MGRNGYKKKKKTGWIVLLILILAAAGVWVFKTKMTVKDEVPLVAYTVQRGTIETYKSFSATLNVRDSETITNTEGATMIKEIYVTADQEVKKGDNILTLGTGKTYEAGINGTVNEIRFRKGDYVWPNITLVRISDMTHLQVSIQVDEYDIQKVEVGQKCFVTVVPMNLEYETVISHVNRMSASNGRVAYYPVTADLDAPENVLPGMTVSVRMQDEIAENVLTLPCTALSFDENGTVSVKKPTENGYENVPITVGISDGMYIEIESGVSEGETVYAASVEATEEEVPFMTRLVRKLFGTRKVINEENSGRGNRGGFSQNDTQGFPSADGMPSGDFPGQTSEPGARMNPEEAVNGQNPSGRSETNKDEQTEKTESRDEGSAQDSFNDADERAGQAESLGEESVQESLNDPGEKTDQPGRNGRARESAEDATASSDSRGNSEIASDGRRSDFSQEKGERPTRDGTVSGERSRSRQNTETTEEEKP